MVNFIVKHAEHDQHTVILSSIMYQDKSCDFIYMTCCLNCDNRYIIRWKSKINEINEKELSLIDHS